MLSDPIADMLTRIRNGYLAKRRKVIMPFSKIKEKIAKILVKEGYLDELELKTKKVGKTERKLLLCKLKYKKTKPAISKIVRISKPSKRIYVTKNKLPKVLGGLGLSIISTSVGLMTGKEAKKKQIGGEYICKVW